MHAPGTRLSINFNRREKSAVCDGERERKAARERRREKEKDVGSEEEETGIEIYREVRHAAQ